MQVPSTQNDLVFEAFTVNAVGLLALGDRFVEAWFNGTVSVRCRGNGQQQKEGARRPAPDVVIFMTAKALVIVENESFCKQDA